MIYTVNNSIIHRWFYITIIRMVLEAKGISDIKAKIHYEDFLGFEYIIVFPKISINTVNLAVIFRFPKIFNLMATAT